MALTILTVLIPLDTNLQSLQNWINSTTVNNIISVTVVTNNILILYN
jgi:hypothetical protein